MRLLLALGLLLASSAALAEPLRYALTVTDAPALEATLTNASRETCFTVSDGGRAAREIGALQVTTQAGKSLTLAPDDDGNWTAPEPVRSIRWRRKLEASFGWGSAVEVSGHDRMLVADSLLVRPCELDVDAEIRAELKLPKGLRALTPWQTTSDGLVTNGDGLVNAGYWAIGRFEPRTFEVGKAHFEAAILEGEFAVGADGLVAWVSEAAREVASLYGGVFPHARVVVVIQPSRAADASPFGEILHSPIPSVHLLAGTAAKADDFRRDWLAVHELFHLGVPVVKPKAHWLHEGLATYYQELLRRRFGRQSKEKMWLHLLDGFARGERDGKKGPLEASSARMHETHCYQRVYWGGAALAMAADLEIRQASGGKRSLDDVLRALKGRDRISPDEFGAEVDRAAGKPVWPELVDRWLAADPFVALAELTKSLGVELRPDDTVRFDPAAPLAKYAELLGAPAKPE